jgi:RNA-directed DNA polymerase
VRREGQRAVLAEHSNDDRRVSRLKGWGTNVQGTHYREGEAGHHVLLNRPTGDTLRSPTVSPILQQIAKEARAYPDRVFTTLAHHIDVDLLHEAYARTAKQAAPGIDGVTAGIYAENLEENLVHLHQRMRSGSYQASAVKRVWLDKDDGSQRPIGMPTFEDKIAQRAVAMILEAVYEQDFYPFSYGFRPGRNPHRALFELRERSMQMKGSWIVDADIKGFFDTIDHDLLRETIKKRINDGGIIRLIGKWLNAGVLDGEHVTYPEQGTPQGGVVSPILANVFLHEVLDDWSVNQIKPRLEGNSFLIRYADDFIIACEFESDANRVMDVLPKRFDRHGLTIHPTKTRLIAFRRPEYRHQSGKGHDTFDFLGLTHFWARSRKGTWVIKRKTAKKRMQRAMNALSNWCRQNRHLSLTEQHRMLCLKLMGHYQYYGITGNFRMLERVHRHAVAIWRFWLDRRSSKNAMRWDKFLKILNTFPLLRPRIVQPI